MRLWLERFGYGADSTLGRLSLDQDGHISHLCYTIEDERREIKKPGETAIPVGVYEIKYRTEGGLTQKYAQRFPEMHKGMLHLQNVPDFKYVYLHIGNDDDDTEGCPLTVTTPMVTSEGEFIGGNSTEAYTLIYELVSSALDREEGVFITVSEK